MRPDNVGLGEQVSRGASALMSFQVGREDEPRLPPVETASPKKGILEWAARRRASFDAAHSSTNYALLLILGLSWAVRVALGLRGGQGFFPDEHRYLRAWPLLQLLLKGALGTALTTVVTTPDHTGFLFVGLPPALAQWAAFRFAGDLPGRTLRLAAIILSLASVASIGFTYLACRKAGGDKREGLVAALLMACATSMTYYSRHLVPYDACLALALGALCLGLDGSNAPSRSILSGFLVGFAFLTYNGYWILCVAVCVVATLVATRWIDRLRRALAIGAGVLSWFLALELAGLSRHTSYFGGMLSFSRTVTQCEFSEGWWSPWAYLWYAEGWVLVVWVLGLLAALWLITTERGPSRARGGLWSSLVLGIYSLMVLFSVGLREFCVYARTSRQMVPFLILATAWAIRTLERRSGRRILLALAAVVVLGALNLVQPFAIRFPADVWRDVVKEFDRVGLDTTLQGPDFPEHLGRRWILLNARFLQPIRGVKPPPAGNVVFSVPHPFQFVPYQYEVLSARERTLLRSTDYSIRLIDTDQARWKAAPTETERVRPVAPRP
jgi:hypothetical protein